MPATPASRTLDSGGAAKTLVVILRADFQVIRLTTADAGLPELIERFPPATARPGPLTPPLPGGADQPAADEVQPLQTRILVLGAGGHARCALQQLTGREREVLALMAEGRSNIGIADRLSVSEHTIEKHVKNIFAALSLYPTRTDHRRVLAALTYLRATSDLRLRCVKANACNGRSPDMRALRTGDLVGGAP
jgi:DNA-binding CsgD family transcriptional regulator